MSLEIKDGSYKRLDFIMAILKPTLGDDLTEKVTDSLSHCDRDHLDAITALIDRSYRDTNFVKIYKHPERLKLQELQTLEALELYQNQMGYINATAEEISKATGRSLKSTKNDIRSLEVLGYIIKVKKSVYRLNLWDSQCGKARKEEEDEERKAEKKVFKQREDLKTGTKKIIIEEKLVSVGIIPQEEE